MNSTLLDNFIQKKPKILSKIASPLTVPQIVQCLHSFAEKNKLVVESFDESKLVVLLYYKDRLWSTSYYFPLYFTQISDGSTSIEIGIKSSRPRFSSFLKKRLSRFSKGLSLSLNSNSKTIFKIRKSSPVKTILWIILSLFVLFIVIGIFSSSGTNSSNIKNPKSSKSNQKIPVTYNSMMAGLTDHFEQDTSKEDGYTYFTENTGGDWRQRNYCYASIIVLQGNQNKLKLAHLVVPLDLTKPGKWYFGTKHKRYLKQFLSNAFIVDSIQTDSLFNKYCSNTTEDTTYMELLNKNGRLIYIYKSYMNKMCYARLTYMVDVSPQ